MEVGSLADVDITTLVDCFLRSFAGYFVQLPTEVTYWEDRFGDSGVDYGLSFGVFDTSQLVGFMIHCIGLEKGQKVAFNTGTGVLPAYRGQGLVDQMMAAAKLKFLDEGIEVYRLEVIDQNTRAIRVYERIGLHIKRRLKCYQGHLTEATEKQIKLVEVPLASFKKDADNSGPYAWDMSLSSILRAGDRYRGYQVFRPGEEKSPGYFIIDREKAHLAQMETPSGDWDGLFSGVWQLVHSIKINNIDAGRTDLIQWLESAHVPNVIDQFEMEMLL
ncbi:MAG: GNAT family N-acetyltransferase [Saprospiraceae bacterium]|nr:GNAT family N-acetyltransferase [Saprospiraceae bacterium]